MISVLLLHLLSTFSLSQALLAHLSPLLLMALRMLAGGALMFGALAKRNMLVKIEKKHGLDFAQVIVFALLVPYYLRYWALSVDSSTSYWYFSGLFITYALSIIFAIEAFSILKTIVIALSYASLYAVLGFPHLSFGLPEGVMIASVISFTYGWIIIRRLIVEYAYEPLVVNGFTMFVAGIISASFCSVSEPLVISGDIMRCMILLIAIILISNVLVHTWYMALLKKYSLTFIQLCSFIIPCWQLVWKGDATIAQICASAVMVSCCALYYALERAKSKQQTPVAQLLTWFYKAGI